MALRFLSGRSLPYGVPNNLPSRPIYDVKSPRPNLIPRASPFEPRDGNNNGIGGGYIALIVILVLVLLANLAALGIWLRRRQTRRQGHSTPLSKEKIQIRRSWRPTSEGWFGRQLPSEDGERLVGGYQRIQPSIKISRPISKDPNAGPTPVFSTNERESLHSVGIMELDAESPEAAYDPYTRSRSRSRSASVESSLFQSPLVSRSTSPTTHTRSRNSSVSSNRSRSNSQTTISPRPLAQNSYSYARNRSPSNGPGSRLPSASTPALLEEDEESISPVKTRASAPLSRPRSSSSSLRTPRRVPQKSLPPPPPLPSPTTSNLTSHIATRTSTRPPIKSPASSPALTSTSLPTPGLPKPSPAISPVPQFDFQEFDTLIESTQVINIAISEPLDIPEGPFSPHGQTKAKLDAARGVGSGWYKSPAGSYTGRAGGSWLV